PPLSGFVAKFSVLGALTTSQEWWALAAGIIVGLLTLFSMVKIWLGAFWAPPTEDLDGFPLDEGETPLIVGRPGAPLLMTLPTGFLLVIIVAIGLFGGPVYELAQRAATDLLEPAGYLLAI